MSYTSPIFEKWSDKWLDADFQSNQVNLDGRSLGAIPQQEDTFRAPVFEDSFQSMTDAELKEWIVDQDEHNGSLDRFVVHGYDQDGEGTCTCNAEAAELNIIQTLQFGRDRVCLVSPISIYMRIARGPNTGSAVGDALEQTMSPGALPIDTPQTRAIMGQYAAQAHFMRPVGYSQSLYQPGWEKTAAWFRSHEYYDVKTAAGACTAIARGYPYHYGRSGHSILGVRLALKSNVIYVVYLNSWGSWGESLHGLRSYGLDSPSMYGTGASRYGAHCTCSVAVPPWEVK